MVSSAYLRLFIFLLAILIPACASSSPTFHMMASAFELYKQGPILKEISVRVEWRLMDYPLHPGYLIGRTVEHVDIEEAQWVSRASRGLS